MNTQIKKAILTLGILIAGVSASMAQSSGMYDKIVYQHNGQALQYTINYTITVTPESAVLAINPSWGGGITEEVYVSDERYSDVLLTLALANLGTRQNPCGPMGGGTTDKLSLQSEGKTLLSGVVNGNNCGTLSGAYGAVFYKLRSLFPDFGKQMSYFNSQMQAKFGN